MAVLAGRRNENYFGLRPMDPMKDLRGVADLIEEAFANDLDRSGQNALQGILATGLSFLQLMLFDLNQLTI